METPRGTALRRIAVPAALLFACAVVLWQFSALMVLLRVDPSSEAAVVLHSLLHMGLWIAAAWLANRLLAVIVWEGLVTRAIGGPTFEEVVASHLRVVHRDFSLVVIKGERRVVGGSLARTYWCK